VVGKRNRVGDAWLTLLVQAAAAGEEGAWVALVHNQGRVIWWVIRAHQIPEAVAMDVYQAVWLELTDNIHLIRDGRCLSSWLATTTRRQCLELLGEPAEEFPVVRADTSSPGETRGRRHRDQIAEEAMDRLPERDRRLLRVLTVRLRPDYQELCDALQIPVGGIDPARARVLTRLRSELSKLGGKVDPGSGPCRDRRVAVNRLSSCG
jgi:RNA polymerase sigma factor (sigma-70 family)